MPEKVHDCFGTILRSRQRGNYEFLCDDCGRPYATMDIRGLRVESPHGGKKDKNLVSLRALKTVIADIESTAKPRK
jgi:hypothetical protein